MTLDQEETVATNNSSTVIIAATGTIVVLLGVGYCMRVVYTRMNEEELEQQAAKVQQEEIYMAKIQSKKSKVEDIDAVIDEYRHHGDSNVKLKAGMAADELEEQYNPMHDFAVFAVGDNKVGGNQTLQQKMNLADVSESDNVEESEGTTRGKEAEREAACNLVAAGDRTQEAMLADDNSSGMAAPSTKAGSSSQEFYPAAVAKSAAEDPI